MLRKIPFNTYTHTYIKCKKFSLKWRRKLKWSWEFICDSGLCQAYRQAGRQASNKIMIRSWFIALWYSALRSLSWSIHFFFEDEQALLCYFPEECCRFCRMLRVKHFNWFMTSKTYFSQCCVYRAWQFLRFSFSCCLCCCPLPVHLRKFIVIQPTQYFLYSLYVSSLSLNFVQLKLKACGLKPKGRLHKKYDEKPKCLCAISLPLLPLLSFP